MIFEFYIGIQSHIQNKVPTYNLCNKKVKGRIYTFVDLSNSSYAFGLKAKKEMEGDCRGNRNYSCHIFLFSLNDVPFLVNWLEEIYAMHLSDPAV
jgi:hypothetical protein